jgi:outer membrane biosynthesis protein TonB
MTVIPASQAAAQAPAPDVGSAELSSLRAALRAARPIKTSEVRFIERRTAPVIPSQTDLTNAGVVRLDCLIRADGSLDCIVASVDRLEGAGSPDIDRWALETVRLWRAAPEPHVVGRRLPLSITFCSPFGRHRGRQPSCNAQAAPP